MPPYFDPNYRRPRVPVAIVLFIVGVAAFALSSCNLGSLSDSATGTIDWAWESGTGTADIGGTYGTQGTAGGVPGARQAVANWTDDAGNLWLFGGYGYPAAGGTVGYLGDLWEFQPSSGKWTWVGGLSTSNGAGVYGSVGQAAASNAPGAREAPVAWTDSAGNLWLFGGVGFDSNGTLGYLNDLWEFSPSTGQWTWMGGASTVNEVGTYGTLKTASVSNVPGARQFMSAWTDPAGNFWLFGGVGFDSTGTTGQLNDLWEYDPSSGAWTWVAGGEVADASGIYGTLGAAAASSVPGARAAASSWTDTAGDLWLFGGSGYDATGHLGYLNDLWKFSPSSGLWTWVNGANSMGAAGTYGVQGKAASGDVPGAREGAATWVDSSGNLWLFGGEGANSTGNADYLNDTWEYDIATGGWNWMSGSSTADAVGSYGTEGKASNDNVPGSRFASASWVDASHNFWLFGGEGLDPNAVAGNLNDLWKVTP